MANTSFPGFQKTDHYLFAGLLIESGFDFADLDLSCDSMHVHDALIARRHQFFLLGQLQDGQVSLELGRFLAVVQIVADHIATADIVVVNVFDSHLDVISCTGEGHPLVLGVVDLSDHHLQALRQNGHRLVFNYSARFDFAVDIQVANISELVDHGDTKGSQRLAFWERNVIKVFKQAGALVPGISQPGMDVSRFDGLDRNKSDIMETTRIFKERSHLLFNVVESLLIPFHCAHLCHHSNQLDNSQSLGQHGMFLGLSVLFEAGFELALLGGDDEDSDIGLAGTHDHVGHIVFMSGCVK